MDRISISGISAIGYHGVFDFEKRDGQSFVVDVVLHVDISRAAASDNVVKLGSQDVGGLLELCHLVAPESIRIREHGPDELIAVSG